MSLDILGKSTTNKPKLDGRSDIELVSGVTLVEQQMETLCNTEAANRKTGARGQRIYNRGVGINLKQFIFRNDTPPTRAAIKNELLRLNELMPSISIDQQGIQVYTDPLGEYKWVVEIRYLLKPTGSTELFVLPLFKRNRFSEVKG